MTTPVADVARREGTAHAEGVRDMFGRIAPTYDLVNRVLSGGLDAAWRRRAVRALHRAPGGAVLDLCAGTMDLSERVAAELPSARLVAADFSAEMLERGRRKAPRAEVVVADAHALPFADGEFAAVVCGFGIRNLSDPSRAVREVRRVLAPRGVFVTLEFFRPEAIGAWALHRALSSWLPAVGGVVSGDREAYAYLAGSIERFHSRRDYEAELARAGFARVRGEDLTLGVASLVTAEVPA